MKNMKMHIVAVIAAIFMYDSMAYALTCKRASFDVYCHTKDCAREFCDKTGKNCEFYPATACEKPPLAFADEGPYNTTARLEKCGPGTNLAKMKKLCADKGYQHGYVVNNDEEYWTDAW